MRHDLTPTHPPLSASIATNKSTAHTLLPNCFLPPPSPQDSLRQHYSPAQHVILLALLSDLGGRPPQSWLAAHEASLLAADEGTGTQSLGLEGWLLLLQCYSKLMYQ